MIQLSGKDYKLVLDEERGIICSFVGNGRELCENNTTPLFSLSIIDEEYYKKHPIYANSFTCEKVEKTENGYAISYRNDGFYVVVYINNSEDELQWKIRVDNHTNSLIEYVDFVGLSVPNDVNGNGSQVLWDFNEGVLISNMNDKDSHFPYREAEYPSQGNYSVFPNMVQSQYLSYLYEDGGLYIGCHDAKYNVKQIDFYRENNSLRLLTRLFSGVCYGDSFQMDYPIVWRFFKGPWQNACDIYKAWYESITDVETIPTNAAIPEWYHKSPLVVTFPIRGEHDMDKMDPNNFYPYENILKVAEEVSAKTDSKLLILLMHWEGSAPWAPPYVWPPYGGETAFKDFSEKLHKQGHYLGVYCSGFGWTQQSNIVPEYNREKDFENQKMAAEMALSPSQALERSSICQGQRFGYDFCPTSKKLKEILSWETEQMYNAGIDYVQLLDQNHGGNSYFCYSKNHGHPHAPGSWQVDAVNDVLRSVQHGKMLFGCESAAAEPFIKNLLFSDNRWELNQRIGEPVPAYAYIYHERVNNFMGNQIGVTLHCSEYEFGYRQAYSFLAGDMPTLVLDNDKEIARFWGLYWGLPGCGDKKPNQENAYALVKELCAWRRAASKYLCYGTMAKPVEYQCDKKISLPCFRARESTLDIPAVMANAFYNGDKRADIFVNYTDEVAEITFKEDLNGVSFDLGENYTKGASNSFTGRSMKIPPLSVVLLERPL